MTDTYAVNIYKEPFVIIWSLK